MQKVALLLWEALSSTGEPKHKNVCVCVKDTDGQKRGAHITRLINISSQGSELMNNGDFIKKVYQNGRYIK